MSPFVHSHRSLTLILALAHQSPLLTSSIISRTAPNMPSPDRPPLPPFAAPPPAPRLAHATIPVPGAPTTTVTPSAAMVINFYGYTLVVARLPETMWVATKYGPLLCTVRVPGDGTGASGPAGKEEYLVTPPPTPEMSGARP